MKNLLVLIIASLFLFSGCKKSPETPTVLAVYTLGTGGECTGAIAAGRFVADTALTAANTITITVDVTVAGPYWIITNTANGISFSEAGTFTSIGQQTAVLTGTGTPTRTGTANFIITPISGPGDSCTFSITAVKGIPPSYYVTCLFNGVYRNFSDSAGGSNSNIPGTSGLSGLDVSGIDTVVNSKEKIDFGVSSPGGVGTGNYADTSSARAYFSYLDNAGQTWLESASGQPSLIIAVTNVSAGIAQGTFSGTIRNQEGLGADSIAITNGLFSVPVK
ncbi:MAG: hypothetical protein M3R50_00070 [Bacteroidota bacterium]|nr:hypothetical protein [Bacteroidota bacterium]